MESWVPCNVKALYEQCAKRSEDYGSRRWDGDPAQARVPNSWHSFRHRAMRISTVDWVISHSGDNLEQLRAGECDLSC